MLEPISSVVDTALVGHYNTSSLAALAVGSTMMGAFTWMFNFLIHAPVQSISESVGESDFLKVHSLTKLALTISFGLSIFLIFLIIPFKDHLYSFMEISGKVRDACDEYFMVRVLGHSSVLFYTVMLSVLRGLAKVNIAFVIVGITTLVNVVFSYLSLYHFDFGLSGVAGATVFSNYLGFFIGLAIYLRENKTDISFLKAKLDFSLVKEFSSKSLNIFGRSFVLTTCFFLSTKVASSVGKIDLAAHQIIMQVWLFASFFTDGLATSASIIGGRLFQHDNEGLYKVFKKLLFMGAQVGAFFTVIFLMARSLLLKMFTTDPSVIDVINNIWPYISLVQIPLAVAYVYDGLIFGINRFDFLRKHMMIGFFISFLPFIYYAYTEKSLMAVWISLFMIGLYRLISNFFCIRMTFVKKDVI